MENYKSLLILCNALADNGITRIITRFEPEVSVDESDVGGPGEVAFTIYHEDGEMGGVTTLSYHELGELERSHLSPEKCGGTTEQLIHDAIRDDGEDAGGGLRRGIVFSQLCYIVAEDPERKTFTSIDKAVSRVRELAQAKAQA